MRNPVNLGKTRFYSSNTFWWGWDRTSFLPIFSSVWFCGLQGPSCGPQFPLLFDRIYLTWRGCFYFWERMFSCVPRLKKKNWVFFSDGGRSGGGPEQEARAAAVDGGHLPDHAVWQLGARHHERLPVGQPRQIQGELDAMPPSIDCAGSPRSFEFSEANLQTEWSSFFCLAFWVNSAATFTLRRRAPRSCSTTCASTPCPSSSRRSRRSTSPSCPTSRRSSRSTTARPSSTTSIRIKYALFSINSVAVIRFLSLGLPH